MGMLKNAAKAAAPMLLPGGRGDLKTKAIKGAAGWAARKVTGGRYPKKRGPSGGSLVAVGLAAAALAVPLGLWLGSRLRDDQDGE